MSQSSTPGSILGIVAPFTGATSAIAGTAGSVPVPAAGEHTQLLRGDATWAGAFTVSSGSPEAVVIGSVGDAYYDSVGFNTYIKATGTNTNTGWLVQSSPTISVQRFTASGTYTPTSGTKYAIIEMVGGGGASGGAPATTLVTQGSVGAAGASGAYLKFLASAAQIGASQTITIGAGGVGASGTTGGTGGTTTFGTLANVTGGAGGAVAGPTTVAVEVGSTTSGSVVTLTTGTLINSVVGQRGGSSASIVSATTGYTSAGQGGNNPLGLAFPFSTSVAVANLVGAGATTGNFGCGGSGTASSGSVQAAKTGVSGEAGVVIITEYK